MAIISTVAATLQDLLGPVAEAIADKHRLIRRRRCFSASTLLSTFVLGYLHKPTASTADLAATAEALGVPVSPQAVDQRFTPALHHALLDLWKHATTRVIAAAPRAVELLRRFTHVLVGDSTTITLHHAHADTYPGCGGKNASGRAAVKVQVRWDLLHGTLTHATLEPGRQPDATSPAAAAMPPPGSLLLCDLGYFGFDRFADLTRGGVTWISRGLSNLVATIDGHTGDLIDWLDGQPADRIDRVIEVGTVRLSCRLIAIRVPTAVAAKRRRVARQKAAKKGRQPSAQRLAWCDWAVYLTNAPADRLTATEVEVAYRSRWQVELLFKLWKSDNRVAAHRSTDPDRQMIEVLARLIAVVVQHWVVLTAGWSDPRLSLVKATRLIRERLPVLIDAVFDRARLEAVLERLVRAVLHRYRINTRRKHPSTAQLLERPELQHNAP